MSVNISNVGFQSAQPSFGNKTEKKRSSVIEGTLIMSGVGALAYGGLHLWSQKQLIKEGENGESYKLIKDIFAPLKKLFNPEKKYEKIFIDFVNNIEKSYGNVVKNKKISLALAGKCSGICAAIVGGTYLVCRGIGALFSKKD